jgi:hypothetical protein
MLAEIVSLLWGILIGYLGAVFYVGSISLPIEKFLRNLWKLILYLGGATTGSYSLIYLLGRELFPLFIIALVITFFVSTFISIRYSSDSQSK